jgi:hypothetical protein
MLTILLAALAHLRQVFRRHRLLALVEGLAAVGLLPLLSFASRFAWIRGLVVALLVVQGVRSVLLFVRADAALRQLHLEEAFLRASHDPLTLRQSLRDRDPGGRPSRILQGLRAARSRPMPGLLAEERRQRLYQMYRHAFQRYNPGRPYTALVVVGLVGAGLVAASPLRLPPPTFPFLSGVLALLLSIAAAGASLVLRLQAARRLDHFTLALAEWTLSEPLADALYRPAGQGYAHTVHYQAPSWFAGEQNGAGRG